MPLTATVHCCSDKPVETVWLSAAQHASEQTMHSVQLAAPSPSARAGSIMRFKDAVLDNVCGMHASRVCGPSATAAHCCCANQRKTAACQLMPHVDQQHNLRPTLTSQQ